MDNEQSSKSEYYEKETDLRGYINVLIKRKKEILGIVFVIVIVTVMYSLIIPKTFEARAIIKIGQIEGENIEKIDEMAVTLPSQLNSKKLSEKLGIDIVQANTFLARNIQLSEEEGFMAITARGSTPSGTVQLVKIVSELIVERHQVLASKAQVGLEEAIKQIKNRINDTDLNIKSSTEVIKNLEEENQIMQKKIANIIEANGYVSEGRGLVVQSYIGAWQSTRNKIENEKARAEGLKDKKQDLQVLLREKELQKTYKYQPTKIEMPPFRSIRISPNRTQNVKIAVFLGLLIGIFYVFASEYFKKVKV